MPKHFALKAQAVNWLNNSSLMQQCSYTTLIHEKTLKRFCLGCSSFFLELSYNCQ